MKFRTEYIAKKSDFTLNPQKPVVLAGSCFTQNIASRMKEHGWETINPCGTLYNPYSIFQALELLTDQDTGSMRFENSLFNSNGLWNSHLFDSSFSSVDKKDCLEEFRIRQHQLISALEAGAPLILTFGTSIIYHLKETEMVVGNCHKQPADNYFRRRMTVDEIVKSSKTFLNFINKRYPALKIIFTVSPVRHIKDGFVGNARSKALLLLGIEEIIDNSHNCVYFPAFEILNDDLRDYRFYASDLVHPSEDGVEYIWEKFKETYLDKEGLRILEEGRKAFKARGHRPKTGALSKPLTFPQSELG